MCTNTVYGSGAKVGLVTTKATAGPEIAVPSCPVAGRRVSIKERHTLHALTIEL